MISPVVAWMRRTSRSLINMMMGCVEVAADADVMKDAADAQ